MSLLSLELRLIEDIPYHYLERLNRRVFVSKLPTCVSRRNSILRNQQKHLLENARSPEISSAHVLHLHRVWLDYESIREDA